MVSELITAEILQNIGLAIGQYIFGRASDTHLDSFTATRKLKKILKEDGKFIEQKFQVKLEKIERIKIKEFFFKDIFQDAIFLYPASNLPRERFGLLESRFCTYAKKADSVDFQAISIDDLVSCVNKHNELVNKHLLSESERIMLKTIQRNQSDLLGYIGNTLNANSELQVENQTLDYTQKQIEGILHAMRMDTKHYKLLMLLYSLGILMIITVAIIILPKIVSASDNFKNISGGLIVATMFFALATVLLLYLFSLSLKNVKIREEIILKYMETLWLLHFEKYKKIFDSPHLTQTPSHSELIQSW